MKPDNTRQHFAEICECICNKIIAEYHIPPEKEAETWTNVAIWARIAWNICVLHKSYPAIQSEIRKQIRVISNDAIPYGPTVMMDVAELKWRGYRDDYKEIGKAEVKTISGYPRAIAYFPGETPDFARFERFTDEYLKTPEVQEYLKGVPADQRIMETQRLTSEYLSKHRAELMQNDDGKEYHYDNGIYDFPIKTSALDHLLTEMVWGTPRKAKMNFFKDILSLNPGLSAISKDAEKCFLLTEQKQKRAYETHTTYDVRTGTAYFGTVPELILAIIKAYFPTTKMPHLTSEALRERSPMAIVLISAYAQQNQELVNDICSKSKEPGLFQFIAQHLSTFNLSGETLALNMRILFSWAFMIGDARAEQHPEEYSKN